MKISFTGETPPTHGVLALGIASGDRLPPSVARLDRKSRGKVRAAIRASGFKASPGNLVLVTDNL